MAASHVGIAVGNVGARRWSLTLMPNSKDKIFSGTPTVAYLVTGAAAARYCAINLVHESTPFAVVPLPDNAWEFTIATAFVERWHKIVESLTNHSNAQTQRTQLR